MPEKWITVLGSFVADLAFRTHKIPAWGETVLGSDFQLGPGGKGSNQAVAAARLGGKVSFISKLGRDTFGDLARKTCAKEKIDTRFVFETLEHPTGGAAIVVDEKTGENAIIVFPGACFHVTPGEIDQARSRISESLRVSHSTRIANSRRGIRFTNRARTRRHHNFKSCARIGFAARHLRAL